MKPCPRCKKIKPTDSFGANARTRTNLKSWCRDCAKVKNAEWKLLARDHTRAWKEEERLDKADPVTWGALHCRHIALYVERVVNRFESKTGKEAPPQLHAIRQLAEQSARELPERPRNLYPRFRSQRTSYRRHPPNPRVDIEAIMAEVEEVLTGRMKDAD